MKGKQNRNRAAVFDTTHSPARVLSVTKSPAGIWLFSLFGTPCLFSPSKHLRIALMVSGKRQKCFLLSQRIKAFLLQSLPKIHYYVPSCLCKYTHITCSSTSSYPMLQWKMNIVKAIRMPRESFVALPCIVLKRAINTSILLHFSSTHFN